MTNSNRILISIRRSLFSYFMAIQINSRTYNLQLFWISYSLFSIFHLYVNVLELLFVLSGRNSTQQVKFKWNLLVNITGKLKDWNWLCELVVQRSKGWHQPSHYPLSLSLSLSLSLDDLLKSTLPPFHLFFKFPYSVLCLVAQSYLTLCDPMDCSLPGSSVHGDSPGKNTGTGCHALLQQIFPTQGLNAGLPDYRRILYFLSHQGSPPFLYLLCFWQVLPIRPQDESQKL